VAGLRRGCGRAGGRAVAAAYGISGGVGIGDVEGARESLEDLTLVGGLLVGRRAVRLHRLYVARGRVRGWENELRCLGFV
jgi:hypothetical protein